LRRDQFILKRAGFEPDLPAAADEPRDVLEDPAMEDDRLGLIFACCHPALALEVRVALTLRYVAGLTTRGLLRRS